MTALLKERSTTKLEPLQRVVLSGIWWDEYIAIGDILRDRPALRLTFDRGTLEIMTTSPEHEKYKVRLGRLVETLAEEFDYRLEPGGNMTFQRDDLQGLEADQCYWIEHEEQVRGKLEWDPSIDPPPDLALEIEVSRAVLARLPIYAALKVPQVWCFDGETLRVYLLQSDGSYIVSPRSPTFPGIPIEELARFLRPQSGDYLSVIRSFRAWVRRLLSRKRNSKGRKRGL